MKWLAIKVPPSKQVLYYEGQIFVHISAGGDFVHRQFGPKTPEHYSIGKPCSVCGVAFKAGDITTIVPTLPASFEDDVHQSRGRDYIARADELHWECLNA